MKLEEAIQSTKFKDQKHKAVLNLLYTAWWLKTLMSRDLKEVGLTHEQYNVLRILKGKHPDQMCVRDIGCRMIENNSNVPRIIDRLQLKKYVERSVSEEDKRETVITLTTAGLDILKAANERVDKVFNEFIQLEENDAGVLNDLLEQLREKQ
ncbi:MarR family transcriptional regulator [Segetibacter sp. 3557_3]|uniref:MarR family winged helix-turn-helix transcriptional regulator n=1 Tax=Segetibacter sp. 3557_3 TaxID=2547429 RepID=UPI00105883C3|nr:MarR family transcriptional regulator [Segetibacter sp. 3557_3]TDH23991.1 MarR family transcriptional regulator [Segetibacter sp. 3557_3]